MREDFEDLECSFLVYRKKLIVQCKAAFAMNFFFYGRFRKNFRASSLLYKYVQKDELGFWWSC